MLRRQYFDASLRLVADLIRRQQALAMADMEISRKTGLARPMSKWKDGTRAAELKSIIAVADALGMEIVLRERQP